jgi:putative serine protease PepD
MTSGSGDAEETAAARPEAEVGSATPVESAAMTSGSGDAERTPAADATRPRRNRTTVLVITAAVVGAVVGATVGALLGVHLGRHSTTTIVRETVPAPDRVTKINDVPSIVARVEPAVVSITTDQGSGTGIIVAASGRVVTNYHVIAGANYIHVLLFHQPSAKAATVVGYDQSDDVALLQIQNVGNLPTALFGDSDQLEVGADVLAIGNALDLPGGLTATSGIVSALGRTIDNSSLPAGASAPPNLIQTDAAINPGNSGGPLLDADGDVIGINTLVLDNLGFAIPIDTVRDLLPALSSGSRAAAITLGIGMQDDNGQVASEYGLSVTSGAVVSEVAPASPAERSGVQPYDVVVAFGGHRVDDSAQLIALIAGHKAGEQVATTIVRGTRTLHLHVVLAPNAPPAS